MKEKEYMNDDKQILKNRPMTEKLNRENQVFAKSDTVGIGTILGILMVVFSVIFFVNQNLFFGFFFVGLGIILFFSFFLCDFLSQKDMPLEEKKKDNPDSIFKEHDQ